MKKIFIVVFILASAALAFAADTYTPNYVLRRPDLDIEDEVTPWGEKYNTNFTLIDTAIGAVAASTGTMSAQITALQVSTSTIAADYAKLASTQTFTGDNNFADHISVLNHYEIQGSTYLGIVGPGSVSVGHWAGRANISGAANAYIGDNAGTANISSHNNTFIGNGSAYSLTLGDRNTFLGTGAGRLAGAFGIRSSSNVMIGYYAGSELHSGSGNIFIGDSADAPTDTQNDYLNIGGVITGSMVAGSTITFARAISAPSIYGDGSNITGLPASGLTSPATFYIVPASAYLVNPASFTVLTGTYLVSPASFSILTGAYLSSPATFSYLISPATFTISGDNLGNHTATKIISADFGITSSTGINAAYYQINGSTVLAYPHGGTLAVGMLAGSSDTGANPYNTYVGHNAGNANTANGGNTFVGAEAGQYHVTGANNIFIGYASGYNHTDGYGNIFIGQNIAAPSATSAYSLNIGDLILGVLNASSVTIKGTLYANSFNGPSLKLSGSTNLSISSEASTSLGGGLRISTNVYIVGFSSASKYYGDGSSLTGVSSASGLTSPATFYIVPSSAYLVNPASFTVLTGTYLTSPATFSYLVSPASFTYLNNASAFLAAPATFTYLNNASAFLSAPATFSYLISPATFTILSGTYLTSPATFTILTGSYLTAPATFTYLNNAAAFLTSPATFAYLISPASFTLTGINYATSSTTYSGQNTFLSTVTVSKNIDVGRAGNDARIKIFVTDSASYTSGIIIADKVGGYGSMIVANSMEGVAVNSNGDVTGGQDFYFNAYSNSDVYLGYGGGKVSIGSTVPTSKLYVSSWTSSLGYIDRTEYPESKEIAYEAVKSMGKKTNGGRGVDHEKLSNFIRSEGRYEYWNSVTNKKETGVELGRNLTASVSAQNEVLKDLINRIDAQEALAKILQKRISELEKK